MLLSHFTYKKENDIFIPKIYCLDLPHIIVVEYTAKPTFTLIE